MFVVALLPLGGCMQATLSPSTDASMTPRDRQLLAHTPYAQANVPEQYLRHVVDYQRKEQPGTILVDTDARYLYYVLPEGKAIRYGVAVGEEAMAFSGVARVGRLAEWPDWVPTADIQARLGPYPARVPGGPANPLGARGHLSLFRQQGHALPDSWHQPARIYRAGDLVRLHPDAQRGRDRSLRPGEAQFDGRGAAARTERAGRDRRALARVSAQRPNPDELIIVRMRAR
ncbi:hypothetical protein ACVIG9_002558 [Bradyrhizobium ottawaense]